MDEKRNRIVFRSGETIDLCVPDATRHQADCVESLNSEKITRWMLVGRWPLPYGLEDEFFARQGKSKDEAVFAIESKTGEYLGNCGLHKIDWVSRTAEAGIFTKESSWGKGVGTEAESLLLNYAFGDLNLRKISANIFAENIASLKAAAKNGFREEGRLKRHIFKNGDYQDLVVLAVFKEEWVTRR
jgi:RimJ/RimL family protein N-acetyltransferase